MSFASPPAVPPLAFRVGVTGSRFLTPEAEPALRRAVAQVLREIRQIVERLAAESWAERAFERAPDGKPRPRLRLLSALAEGADRLVAEEGLKLGYLLEAALPFAQEEYEKDFSADAASLAGFRDLLGKAAGRVLALDGGRGEDQSQSYAAIGRLVVRNSDLLIAIWDEETPAKGPGGTRDTIRYAMRSGPPVWWIDAKTKQEPAFLAAEMHFHDRQNAPRGEAALQALRQYVDAAVRPPLKPPAQPAPGSNMLIEASAGMLRRLAGSEPDPLFAFLKEKPRPARGIWSAYARLMRLAAPRARRGWEQREAEPPSDDADRNVSSTADYWRPFYGAADALAQTYADRYRSSYVYVLLLAALALAATALSPTFRELELPGLALAVTIIELVALAAIVLIVITNVARRWHDRWIAYRLLAELCRKQQFLSLLALSLPKAEVTRASGSTAVKHAWINWYFDAALRGSPLPSGWLGGRRLAAIRSQVEQRLIKEQRDYHHQRRAASEEAASALAGFGGGCFLLTLICIGLEIAAVGGPWVGILAAVLPALAAAPFGIRAYAELEVLADESTRMAILLEGMQQRIGRLSLDRPLASQDLSLDLLHLATDMLADVAGWAQLFRMKIVAVV